MTCFAGMGYATVFAAMVALCCGRLSRAKSDSVGVSLPGFPRSAWPTVAVAVVHGLPGDGARARAGNLKWIFSYFPNWCPEPSSRRGDWLLVGV
jgi:hypothetical protein